MSKSQSTNTNRRHHGRLALALAAGGLIGGCADNETWTIDPQGYDGLGEQTFSLLANPCTIVVGTPPVVSTMSISLRSGEVLYLSLRGADNKVVASAHTASSGECAVDATARIDITEQALFTGTEKVFLDYINGPFALGTTVASVVTPGVTMALGAGSKVVVRGSSGADKIYLGTTTAVGNAHSWINVNGDPSPDVRMDGVTDVKVSSGAGADIISADGGNGTGTPLAATVTFAAFGGPDNDTLTGGLGASTLDGGDGDDKFVQTATIGPDTMSGGKGVDTVDYSARTAAVNVTICTAAASATDPGLSTTHNTTCHGNADQAKIDCVALAPAADPIEVTCMATPDAAQTACITAASDALTACRTPALLQTRSDCKLVGPTSCAAVFAACVGLTCVQDQIDCNLLCDGPWNVCGTTQTSSLLLCTNTRNALCDTLHDAACAAVKVTSYATCDAIAVTELAASGIAQTAHCELDDGAAGELDTVNNDIEIVLGGKGDDTLSAFGAPCTDQAATNPKLGCTLKGNDGNDTLTGSAQNDTLDGGAGNDLLMGGLGNDTFIGGAGLNTVTYADRAVTVKVSLDAAKLWVLSSTQNGQTGESDVIAADIQNLIGGMGDDSLRGNALANIIRGGAGNDTIEGGAGNDALYGDAGNDLVYGGPGNDALEGGAGADTLVGGDDDDLIDAVDSPAFRDTLIDGDGPNAFGAADGTAPGTANYATTDGSVVDNTTARCTVL